MASGHAVTGSPRQRRWTFDALSKVRSQFKGGRKVSCLEAGPLLDQDPPRSPGVVTKWYQSPSGHTVEEYVMTSYLHQREAVQYSDVS